MQIVKAFSLQKDLMFPSNCQYIVYHICNLWKVSFIVQTMEVSQEKKSSIPCRCFCRCTAATSMPFSLRRLCIFREVGHAMILLIPFCILLHYFFMTWTKFNWKNLTFLERLYRLCGKGQCHLDLLICWKLSNNQIAVKKFSIEPNSTTWHTYELQALRVHTTMPRCWEMHKIIVPTNIGWWFHMYSTSWYKFRSRLSSLLALVSSW